jgi:hypothetical protein
MEHVRQWARDWWRVRADARLLLAGWDFNVCILCVCYGNRVKSAAVRVILCVCFVPLCIPALCSMRAKVDFATVVRG